ncbi:MAG: Flp family type IVb pilin [Thermoguttaceae bacterium]|jgi:pilus assembly protein Flp/PilA
MSEGRFRMYRFAAALRRFFLAEDGPTAVEYAVMLSMIVMVCLAAIITVGQNTNVYFQRAASSIH